MTFAISTGQLCSSYVLLKTIIKVIVSKTTRMSYNDNNLQKISDNFMKNNLLTLYFILVLPVSDLYFMLSQNCCNWLQLFYDHNVL